MDRAVRQALENAHRPTRSEPFFPCAGSHTARIVGRTPGARIDRFELAPVQASVAPPQF